MTSLGLHLSGKEVEIPALSGEAWFLCVLLLAGRCCRWQDTWLGRVSLSDEVTEKLCGKSKAFRLGIWAGELGNVAREKGDCLSCQYRSVCWGSFWTSVSAILTLAGLTVNTDRSPFMLLAWIWSSMSGLQGNELTFKCSGKLLYSREPCRETVYIVLCSRYTLNDSTDGQWKEEIIVVHQSDSRSPFL